MAQFVNTEKKEETSRTLLKHINNGKIVPYICEIAITLESITKYDRPYFWENYQPTFDTDQETTSTGRIKATISMGPSPEAHPGLPNKLMTALEEAAKLNFKLLRMTNVGTVRCNDIPNELCKTVDHESFHKYAEDLAKFSNHVTSQGWGKSWRDHFCETYNLNGILDARQNITESERGKFSKAIAEWVDGDSLAAH